MVRVCDAIMGTGKSSAAITYLNEHPHGKYIYITPYLDEATRIKHSCPGMHFVEPSAKIKKYEFKKTVHTAALIKEGRNITTTHQAFKNYSQATLNDIKEQGYVLIIDENVDVLDKSEFHPGDLQLAVEAGYIKEENGIYTATDKEYHGTALRELFSFLKSRELIRIVDENENNLFYWALPPDLLTSFKDVFILTYLFKGQSLHYFMKMYSIPYEYIGIEKRSDGTFCFGSYPGYTPEYVKEIDKKLHILNKGRLNDIGDDYHALSMNWFKNEKSNVSQLKKNVSNCFNNIWRDIPADRRLWGTYNGSFNQIKGKGYTKSFLTFNAKATNNYKDRDCLVYITNLFMNANEKVFYKTHGVEVDENMYALSIMVQWIWRSAIREGNEVYLYIPSRRMRNLLTNWIKTVSKEGNAHEY